MRFGFMTCKRTTYWCNVCRKTDAGEIHSEKLDYFGLMSMGKEFDRILREMIRWRMRKLGVDECHGNSDDFEVNVGMQQGSVFSSFLLPAALRCAQCCRYLIYPEADVEVFRRCKNVLEVLYHHAKFGRARISPPPGWPKTLSFLSVCLFVCLFVTLLNVRDCVPDFAMKALEHRNDFDTVG